MLANIVKWVAIPVVLTAALLSGLAGRYEPLFSALVCMSAITFVQRAALLRQHVWGAGWIAIAILFSPFCLAVKIFLLLGLACVAAFSAALAGFRMRTSPAMSPAS
jgi:hypothetical protein